MLSSPLKKPHNALVINGFNPIAKDYDAVFSHTALGQLLRQRVWQHLGALNAVSSAKTVLELNCGTGEDAVWLAQQGWQVLATDVSDQMLAVAQAKASRLAEHNIRSKSAIFPTPSNGRKENLI